MSVVVYQSFRRENVPNWIRRCMESVKSWAKAKGYVYRFYDDEMFEFAPDWYRARIKNQIHLTSDLARLEIARSLMEEGYEQTIWVDADVLIFNPTEFSLPFDRPYAFCKEVYVDSNEQGQLMAHRRVNNAVTLLQKGNSFLDFYIDACKRIVAERNTLRHTSIGTEFLTNLNSQIKLDFIDQVGLFSPLVIADIAKGGGPALSGFISEFSSQINAANLCFTFNNLSVAGIEMKEALFERVIDSLLSSKGEIVNQRVLP